MPWRHLHDSVKIDNRTILHNHDRIKMTVLQQALRPRNSQFRHVPVLHSPDIVTQSHSIKDLQVPFARRPIIRQTTYPFAMFPSRRDDPLNRIDELGLIPSGGDVTQDR